MKNFIEEQVKDLEWNRDYHEKKLETVTWQFEAVTQNPHAKNNSESVKDLQRQVIYNTERLTYYTLMLSVFYTARDLTTETV